MKAVQKITSVSLALVFLFSSLGITISSMVCLKTGKGQVTFSSMDDCCSKKDKKEKPSRIPRSNAILEKASCCDVNTFTIKLNEFQKAEHSIAGEPVILQSLFTTAAPFTASKAQHASAWQFADLPPPLSGRTLLTRISTLLI